MNEDSRNEQAKTDKPTVDMEENTNVSQAPKELEEPNTNQPVRDGSVDEHEAAEARTPVEEDDEPVNIGSDENGASTDKKVTTTEDTSEDMDRSEPSESEPTDTDEPPPVSDVAPNEEETDVDQETVADVDQETVADVDQETVENVMVIDQPQLTSDDAQAEASVEDEDTTEPVDLTGESLEEAYDSSIKAFTEGEIVKGWVVDVSREEVMIDIGFKSEGYIPSAEFDTDREGLPNVRQGDQISVYIVRREDADGQIVLSKKIADQTLVWDEISDAFEAEEVVKGEIVERIKGGLRVNIGSLRAFLPASQIELRPVQDFDQYIGQTLDMKIVKLSKRRRNIVLSRRVLLEQELASRKADLLLTLEVDQVRSGAVKNITSFGAFVDLGGIDGLLHKTDMSWGKVNHPSEVVAIGDEIEVIVIGVDRENEKVSLGLKQRTADPWLDIEEKYPVGSTVHGTVVNIVNYGAFLELEEGVEGLIHVSEMSWTRRNVAPSKIVNKGDEIDAIVLELNKGSKRISLGLKQLESNPWELLAQKYPIGSKIVGRVRNLTDFGAFVEIEEGIDGLIHTSDLSWTKRDIDPRDALEEGVEVEVMVLQIDPAEQRVSLGLKQIEPDPWLQVPEKYKIGSVVSGEIVNLTSFGAFAKLEDGIEGLIHISELSQRRIEKPEEVASIGDKLDLKVIHLDPNERRIGLSLKAAHEEQERATVAEYQQRQQRPARPARPQRHQPEETRESDEPSTMLGALLKEELDKSNSEN